MKVEFITEEVPIGTIWQQYSQRHQVRSTRRDPDSGETIHEICLPEGQELPVLAHDGLKFADVLFKNRGETTKVDFENGSHIEGLGAHKLLNESKNWITLDQLAPGARCLDKDLQPCAVLRVTKGAKQDVFDIQVPDGHHYIANGMVSHNSTLAAQLGYNWADMGEDVTIVPLEMSKREMTARLMANASSIDVRKILFGKMSEDEKKKYWKSYKRFVNGKKEAGGTFRVFKPDSDMTIEEIFASIYPFGSRVVIIDYISLLKGVDGDDAWQKLGAVARYCKIYAEAHNIIVVLLCQVSDEGVIRYARSIAEHANYAWKFVATAATREHEIINIEQLKARNGRMFDFTLRALLAVMQIRDLELEEREDLQSKSTTKKDGKGKGKKFKGKDSKEKEKEDKGPAQSKPRPDYMKDLSEDEDED
jgi:hypothetical protein